MNFVFTSSGLRIGRDVSDKKARSETEVIFRACHEISNAHRFNPSRYGLTGSQIGLYIGYSIRRSREIYWHANYQIEDARKAFNDGALFLHKL